MKLQKEQLIPGRWYHAVVYNDDYFIQFKELREQDDIIASNYYYENKLYINQDDSAWGYYGDIEVLELATRLPSGEEVLETNYEIY